MLMRSAPFIFALSCFVTPAFGAQTALQINSDPGDYIGQGEQEVVSSDELDFTVSRSDDGQSVHFTINNFNRPDPKVIDWWDADFAAPVGLQLIPGAYEKATRWPFEAATEPGLNFDGNGRGCNMLTGRFDVLEAVYDASTNEVLKFAVDFEQHCEGGAPALFGAIRYNSDVPLPSLLTARIELENPLNPQQCVEAASPDGATISLHGSSTSEVSFRWSTSTRVRGSGPDFSFPLGNDKSAVVTLTVRDVTGERLSRSLPVCVSDTTPPTVTILSPQSGEALDIAKTTLKVEVSDAVDKAIKRYQVFVGNTALLPLDKQGQSTIKLFRRVPRSSVQMDITVQAQDASGNIGTASVTVTGARDLGLNF